MHTFEIRPHRPGEKIVAASAPSVTLRIFCVVVPWSMKTLGLLGIAITAVIGLSQPAHGGSSARREAYYFPPEHAYDSHGTVPIVRQVQLALQDDGYYTADNQGNFCFETRWAVRRYQRDKGLAITGKVDTALLKSLGLR